jgi:glucose-1-phosphate cytidylyltransferase
MLTYGDGLGNVNIKNLIDFHKSHGKVATITTVRPTSRYGILDLDNSSQVMKFTEKPQAEGWASAGFCVFNRSLFDYLPEDDCMLEHEPLRRLAVEGQLMAYQHDGFFFPMDTYREYQQLNEMWEQGNSPWRIWK